MCGQNNCYHVSAFVILFIDMQHGTYFVDLLWFFFCLTFAMPLCASVYVCLVVTCWERVDLLALVCGV